jgi:hypothetical protein
MLSFLLLVLVSGDFVSFPGPAQDAIAWFQPRQMQSLQCGVAVSSEFVFVYTVNTTFDVSFVSRTLVTELIAESGGVVGAAVAFDYPLRLDKGIFLAIADSNGGISFSNLQDCKSVWVLQPSWTIHRAGRSGFFSTLRSGSSSSYRFISSTNIATVGWVQGVSGYQLGLTHLQNISAHPNSLLGYTDRAVLLDNSFQSVMDENFFGTYEWAGEGGSSLDLCSFQELGNGRSASF